MDQPVVAAPQGLIRGGATHLSQHLICQIQQRFRPAAVGRERRIAQPRLGAGELQLVLVGLLGVRLQYKGLARPQRIGHPPLACAIMQVMLVQLVLIEFRPVGPHQVRVVAGIPRKVKIAHGVRRTRPHRQQRAAYQQQRQAAQHTVKRSLHNWLTSSHSSRMGTAVLYLKHSKKRRSSKAFLPDAVPPVKSRHLEA